MRQGVIIRTVINNMTVDGATTDPIQQAARDALIALMAAKQHRSKKPSYDRKAYQMVLDMLPTGAGASTIAKATGLTRQTILRIKSDPTGAKTALSKWDTR